MGGKLCHGESNLCLALLVVSSPGRSILKASLCIAWHLVLGWGEVPERVPSVRRIVVQDKNKANIGVASLVAQLVKNLPAMHETWV